MTFSIKRIDYHQLIDGKMVSAEIRNQLKQQILDEGLTPKLSIIIVGNRVDSATYVRMETKACNEVGILTEDIKENPQNQIAESSRRTHTDWDKNPGARVH